MGTDIYQGSFVWDEEKERWNRFVHGVDFSTASHAFFDPDRIVAVDEKHSQNEPRYFCLGRIDHRVLTVRFTYRDRKIRIIGAGYWRKGRSLYEKKNKNND